MRWVFVFVLGFLAACAGDPPGAGSTDAGVVQDAGAGFVCSTNDDCGPTSVCDDNSCRSCSLAFTRVVLPEDQNRSNTDHTLLSWIVNKTGDDAECQPVLHRMRFEMAITRTNQFMPFFNIFEAAPQTPAQRWMLGGYTNDAFTATGEQYTARGQWDGTLGIINDTQLSIACVNCDPADTEGLSITTRFQDDYLWDRGDGEVQDTQHDSIAQTITYTDN